ncbi:hypothetical protein ABR776_26435 [Bacillus cereus]|uniref:hypothetical protein n=1 Tax=unclassified Bacillus cereus group TaxID=2750818 RepID=UPI00086C6292|nr:hypothetical protein [Bacillus cereus group sp. BfR-BA-01324]SCN40914.1 Uncharacterized protein BC067498_05468 [Bacillus cereus]
MSEPLLSIVLADINGVPEVHYKGEKIDGKVRVSFDYKTDDVEEKYPNYIHIEHVESHEKGINTKIVQYNHPI